MPDRAIWGKLCLRIKVPTGRLGGQFRGFNAGWSQAVGLYAPGVVLDCLRNPVGLYTPTRFEVPLAKSWDQSLSLTGRCNGSFTRLRVGVVVVLLAYGYGPQY